MLSKLENPLLERGQKCFGFCFGPFCFGTKFGSDVLGCFFVRSKFGSALFRCVFVRTKFASNFFIGFCVPTKNGLDVMMLVVFLEPGTFPPSDGESKPPTTCETSRGHLSITIDHINPPRPLGLQACGCFRLHRFTLRSQHVNSPSLPLHEVPGPTTKRSSQTQKHVLFEYHLCKKLRVSVPSARALLREK